MRDKIYEYLETMPPVPAIPLSELKKKIKSFNGGFHISNDTCMTNDEIYQSAFDDLLAELEKGEKG